MSDKFGQPGKAIVCIGCVLAIVLAGARASLAAAQDEGKPATPAEQFQALQKEFQQAAYAHFQTTNVSLLNGLNRFN